jgi:hypothetical protein
MVRTKSRRVAGNHDASAGITYSQRLDIVQRLLIRNIITKEQAREMLGLPDIPEPFTFVADTSPDDAKKFMNAIKPGKPVVFDGDVGYSKKIIKNAPGLPGIDWYIDDELKDKIFIFDKRAPVYAKGPKRDYEITGVDELEGITIL